MEGRMTTEKMIAEFQAVLGLPASRKVTRRAATYSLQLRGDEWRVLHGNKIVSRHAAKADADAAYDSLTGRA
jgi:hypothetical protein